MSKIKVIVNPCAGRGYGAKVAPAIRRYFAELGADFDMVHTAGVGHATLLAEQALDAGFDIIVAVGGDGTSHEIVNGMMRHTNGRMTGTLGCIPAGSGNDFAHMNGAPDDPKSACRIIVEGATRNVDVGLVTIDDRIKRYFDNAVGIGFDGLVTIECQKVKFVRGLALYLPVVLKTIFLNMPEPLVEIDCDGEIIRKKAAMTVISNGPREGGGFFVAPGARGDDGHFDLLIANAMSKIGMLGMIPRFLKGTHVGHKDITIKAARHVIVSSADPLYLHVDGEILCPVAHRVEAQIIPGCLRMIAPKESVGDRN